MEINGHNSTWSLTLVSGMIWLTDKQLKAGADADDRRIKAGTAN